MTDTTTRAKRGDLAIIERQTSYAVQAPGERCRTERSTEYRVTVVTNVTRDGQVKAVRSVWGEAPQLIARMVGYQRTLLVSQRDIDVDASMATARAHTYPNSTTPRDYASLDDVREALRAHRAA